MAAKRGPTARRLELGIQLRKLRESACMEDGRPMTRRVAVQGTRISEPSLHRIETGMLGFRNIGDLRKLLAKYGVEDDDTVEHCIELNRDGARRDWMVQFRGYMPPAKQSYFGIEAEAQEIRGYHPTLVFGLLQTRAYARALFEESKTVEDTTAEFIEQNVEARAERKRRTIEREPAPARLWVVLGEAGLRHPVGDYSIMRDQYAEITRLTRRDNVTVQVLPMNGRRYRSPYDLTVLDLGDTMPLLAEIDSGWGTLATSDKPREVNKITRRFDALRASALPPEDTADFMHYLAGELNTHDEQSHKFH